MINQFSTPCERSLMRVRDFSHMQFKVTSGNYIEKENFDLFNNNDSHKIIFSSCIQDHYQKVLRNVTVSL